MVINLWYNERMKLWRWSLSNTKTLEQHAGSQEDLRNAMDDIENAVKYVINNDK